MMCNNIYEKIKASDFLISDEYSIHRLVGLRYDSNWMKAPEVSFVCLHTEMALAKYYTFLNAKKIFRNGPLSARLFHKYCCGESLKDYEDLQEAAKLYASYYKTKRTGTLPK